MSVNIGIQSGAVIRNARITSAHAGVIADLCPLAHNALHAS